MQWQYLFQVRTFCLNLIQDAVNFPTDYCIQVLILVVQIKQAQLTCLLLNGNKKKKTDTCSKFLSAQILFQNSDFKLESKPVFRIPISSLRIEIHYMKRLSGFSFKLTETKKNHLHLDCHFFKPRIRIENLYRTSEGCQKPQIREQMSLGTYS